MRLNCGLHSSSKKAFLCVFLFCLAWSVTGLCEAKNLAILIGVTHYDQADFEDDENVLSVGNDVSVLKSRLEEGSRDGFETLVLTGEKASLAEIESALRQSLSPENCRERSCVLVFFSGHGTSGTNDSEKVLLAVKDTNSQKEETFLPAQFIRELLANCGAANTLFLLDSCHAGGVKSDALPPFRITSVPRVITFASSRVYENSGTWAEKNLSNFSYWLNEALKGYADLDKNGKIDTVELTRYVTENMGRKTALQHPVLVMSEETKHFEVFTPRARTIYGVLDDFAEQIVLYASLKKITTLKMVTFRPLSSSGTTRSADFEPANFNQMKKVSIFCSEELKRRIALKSEGRLTVSTEPFAEGAALKCELKQNGRFYFLTCSLDFPQSQPNESADSQPKNLPEAEAGQNAAPIIISQRVLMKATYESPEPQNVPENYVRSRVSIEVRTPYGYQNRPIERINGQYYVTLNEGEVYRIILQRFRQSGTDPLRLAARIFVDGRSTLPQKLSEVCASSFQMADRTQEPVSTRSTPKVTPAGTAKFQLAGPAESSENSDAAPHAPSASPSGTATPDASNEAVSSALNAANASSAPASAPAQAPNSAPASHAGAVLSSGLPEESPCVPLDVAEFYVLGGANVNAPFNFNARHEFEGFLKTGGNQASYREFLVAPASQSAGDEEHIGLISVAIYELVKQKTRGTIEGNWGETSAPIVDGLTTDRLLQMITLRYLPANEMAALRQGQTVSAQKWAE